MDQRPKTKRQRRRRMAVGAIVLLMAAVALVPYQTTIRPEIHIRLVDQSGKSVAVTSGTWEFYCAYDYLWNQPLRQDNEGTYIVPSQKLRANAGYRLACMARGLLTPHGSVTKSKTVDVLLSLPPEYDVDAAGSRLLLIQGFGYPPIIRTWQSADGTGLIWRDYTTSTPALTLSVSDPGGRERVNYDIVLQSAKTSALATIPATAPAPNGAKNFHEVMMNSLLLPLLAIPVLVAVSCTAARHTPSASIPTTRRSAAESPTSAQELVRLIDRSPEERLLSWTSVAPDAAALGIATPPSPEVWQQMLAAALHASPSTQAFLFRSAVRFDDSYGEATYRAFKGHVSDTWVRMACGEWEITKWREEAWAAESVLNLTKDVLQADQEPQPPNGGYSAEGYWTEVTLRAMWNVPNEAATSRANLLAWVNGVLSNREHWHYSRERKLWVAPASQAAESGPEKVPASLACPPPPSRG